ncbi:MAG: 16S rRNA (uracil(1498)-N(3))-methyltransferase [Acidobacteriota bacterium]
MYRAFVEIREKRAWLPEDEQHHLLTVRRSRPGDQFIGLDGKGKAYLCALAREGRESFGEILQELPESRETPLSIILAQALVKKDKFDWIVQKAVELGVKEIIPIKTFRTEVRIDDHREEKKKTRWQKIMMAAVKQSGRTRIPELAETMTLEECLKRRSASLRFVLDEEGGGTLAELIRSRSAWDSCCFFIGPEGGWDEEDRKIFRRHSVPPVQLGPRTLRAETAPLVVLSILQYELGDLAIW